MYMYMHMFYVSCIMYCVYIYICMYVYIYIYICIYTHVRLDPERAADQPDLGRRRRPDAGQDRLDGNRSLSI